MSDDYFKKEIDKIEAQINTLEQNFTTSMKETFDKIMDINFKATFFGCQEAIKYMKKTGFITTGQYIKSVIIRGGSSIAPNWLRKFMFKTVLRK